MLGSGDVPLREIHLGRCAVGATSALAWVLLYGTDLYVAFHALDDNTATGDDAVYIGVGAPSPLNNGWLAKILLDTTTTPIASVPSVVDPTPPVPNAGFTVVHASTSNATSAAGWTGNLTTGIPAWMQDVASWRDPPGVSWGITFKVDLATFGYSSAPVPDEIRIFLGTRYVDTGGIVTLPDATDTAFGNETIVPGALATWTRFGPPGSGCVGAIVVVQ